MPRFVTLPWLLGRDLAYAHSAMPQDETVINLDHVIRIYRYGEPATSWSTERTRYRLILYEDTGKEGRPIVDYEITEAVYDLLRAALMDEYQVHTNGTTGVAIPETNRRRTIG